MERPGIWADLDEWILDRCLDLGELFALAKVGGWHASSASTVAAKHFVTGVPEPAGCRSR